MVNDGEKGMAAEVAHSSSAKESLGAYIGHGQSVSRGDWFKLVQK